MPPKQSLGGCGIMSSNTGLNAAWTLGCLKLPIATLVVFRDLQATHSDTWGFQKMYQKMLRIHMVQKIEPRLVRCKVAPVLLSYYHHSSCKFALHSSS